MLRQQVVLWIAQLGADPNDDLDRRLQKRVLALYAALFSLLSFVWGLIYLLLGERLAAAVLLAYSGTSLLSLGYFHQRRRYAPFRFTQFFLILTLPLFLIYTLGGFTASGAVILWSLLAPILALLLSGPASARRWSAAYLACLLLGASMVEQPTSSTLSRVTIHLFFLFNLGGVSLILFVLLKYFAGRDDDFRLQDRALVAITLLLFTVGSLWSALYITSGEPLAAVVPLVYAAVSLLSVFLFGRRDDFEIFRTGQLLLVLLLPFLLNLVLGGVEASSGVILWSFFSPILALLLFRSTPTRRWFQAYLLILTVGTLFGTTFRDGNQLPLEIVHSVLIFNMAAVSGVTFLLLYFLVGQKNVVRTFILPVSQAIDDFLTPDGIIGQPDDEQETAGKQRPEMEEDLNREM